MKRRRILTGVIVLISVVPAMQMASALSFVDEKSKAASLKGKIFRSDTKEPIADALILLLDDEKSDKHDKTVEARTDDQGDYVFQNVESGKYTVSIRAWYETQEDAPCKLLMAKTSDKDSMVMVARDKDRYVQQVFIKGFSIKAGKAIVKDFDFACKSMFGK